MIFIAGGFLAAILFLPKGNPVNSILLPTPLPTKVIEKDNPPLGKSEKPVRIQIPKIATDAVIEEVGLDFLGRMDIPKDFNNTGWYSLGTKPGDIGSAVIDGHVDTPQGEPSTFASIHLLSPNDQIVITGDKGTTYTFKVIDSTDYPLSEIPMEKIFESNISESRLNLITCSGVWDSNKKCILIDS